MIAKAARGSPSRGRPDAAGIEHDHAADLKVELDVGVAHADDVGFHVVDPLGPGGRVFEQVFVEGIARGGVHQQEALAVQGEAARDRQLKQVAALFRTERVPHRRPRRLGQIAEPGLAGDGYALGDAVVVIAADRVGRVVHRPANAGKRVGPVIDQIAQAEADVDTARRWPRGPPSWREYQRRPGFSCFLIACKNRERQRSFAEISAELNSRSPSITNYLV